MIGAGVSATGPVFDGRAAAALAAFTVEAPQVVAQAGAVMVRARLAKVLRNRTGYYESRVRADRADIHDSNVVYGPWLEGVGSRNETTRFKGYFTFRLTAQELDRRAGRIAEELLKRRYMGRLQ